MAALLALLSSAVWGTADFGGGLLARRLPPVAVVAWSQVAALVAVVAVALATTDLTGPRGWIGWSALAGLSGAGGLVAFYAALASGTMGVVSPIAALGAVVPVAAGLLAGDRPTGLQYAGIVVGLAGAVTASGPELKRPGPAGPAGPAGAGDASLGSRSVGLAVVAGLLFGVSLLGIQRGAQDGAVLTLLGMRLSSTTVLVALVLLMGLRGAVSAGDLPALAAVGLADVSANLLFALASTRGMASVVAVLGALYPVATVLLGALILGERLLPVQRVGVGLALAGVGLLAAG